MRAEGSEVEGLGCGSGPGRSAAQVADMDWIFTKLAARQPAAARPRKGRGPPARGSETSAINLGPSQPRRARRETAIEAGDEKGTERREQDEAVGEGSVGKEEKNEGMQVLRRWRRVPLLYSNQACLGPNQSASLVWIALFVGGKSGRLASAGKEGASLFDKKEAGLVQRGVAETPQSIGPRHLKPDVLYSPRTVPGRPAPVLQSCRPFPDRCTYLMFIWPLNAAPAAAQHQTAGRRWLRAEAFAELQLCTCS